MADQAQFLERFLAIEADLKAFLRSLVRNHREFDDVYQAVVLRLLEKFDLYDASRPFIAWACTVAANVVWGIQRQSQRMPLPLNPEVVAQIVDAFERQAAEKIHPPSDQIDALEKCLETLPGDAREMLTLRYDKSLSVAEVAERVGRTTPATQQALSRIRRRLGDCIEQRLAAPKGDAP